MKTKPTSSDLPLPKTTPKKSAIDVFIAKDTLSKIWFAVAVLTVVGAGWYLMQMAEILSRKPQFVVMDKNGTFYLSKALDFQTAKEVHAEQTQSALEARFELSPEGWKHPERYKRIFNSQMIKDMEEARQAEIAPARTQNMFTSVHVGDIKILGTSDQIVRTSCDFQIHRNGLFSGRRYTVVEQWQAVMDWMINQDMATNGKFPTVCVNAVFNKKGTK